MRHGVGFYCGLQVFSSFPQMLGDEEKYSPPAGNILDDVSKLEISFNNFSLF